ncbi:hypothetical protein GCM10027614_11980 [Micromonospora vulcania]
MVRYFLAVGDGILRALRDRPTMLERWPRGVFEGATIATRQTNRGDAFYQKRLPAGAPEWVRTAHITFPSGRTADEVAPSELAVVIWAANLGTLRFHPWPVVAADVERPDQLRIDLDPMPGVGFEQVVPVAREVRAFLAELGLTGYPKTTGGRGLHIYLSIERGGASATAGGRCSRWAGRCSAGCPSWSPPPGGASSGTGRSSSTTTRCRGTTRWPRRTRSGRRPGRWCPRR